jgi:O-antigen/teichoic acid export membrane protein
MRVAAGAAWMVAFKLLERVIGMLSVIILARMLVPADFGLVAMATAIVAIIELLSAFSFDAALIQRQHATEAHYDTAWTLNVLMAGVCALLLVAVAFPARAFYGDERLGPIILWLALATLIRGFENIGIVEFRKELRLHRDFQLLMAKRITVFATTITVALATRSYWALVVGILAGSVAGVGFSYLFHPYRPGLNLSVRKELLRFSKWMVFSNVINTFTGRAADFVIGKSLGAGPLGLFNLAHEIAHLPSTELAAPINRAVFPGYAKVASDRTQLTAHFLGVLGLIALLTTPLALGTAAIAPLLVPYLLGDHWRDAVPLMEILVLSGLLASLRTNAGYVLLAMGRSDLLTFATGLRFAIVVPALIAGTIEFGALGAAWTMFATSIVMLPITHTFMHRMLGTRWSEYGRVLWRPTVAAVGMAVAVRELLGWAQQGFAAHGEGLTLASAVVVGIVTYCGLVGVLWAAAGFPRGAETRALEMLREFLRRWVGGSK